MTELRPVLARLGLQQYLQAFVSEGFDTWETLCDVTESDLTVLGVKLGHRRKLQREIAISRGVDRKHGLNTHPYLVNEEGNCGDDEKGDSSRPGAHGLSGSRGKRKYRRHPKPDENAPDRAPSAYVIFSNKVREDVKSQNLSFSETAKRVGEEWQHLSASTKASYEAQASAAKEKYRADLHEYKKTDGYREYNEYLADFKKKNPSRPSDKRPRLEKEPSTHSSHSGGSRDDSNVDPECTKFAIDRRRADSFGSTATYSSTSGYPSPPVAGIGKPYFSDLPDPPQLQSSSPTSHSPSTLLGRRDPAMPYLQSPFRLQFVTDASGRGIPIRKSALESSDRHLSSTSAAGLMQDWHALRNAGSGSPMTTMQKTNQESSKSSNSSPTSSTVSTTTTAPSSHPTSLTSDERSPRALPPPYPSALKPVDSPVSFGSGLAPSNAQPTPYIKPSFSPSTSSGNGHGSAHLKPVLSGLPQMASPLPQFQANSTPRSENRISSGLQLMDLNPAQPSFKGEYDEDLFPTSETDPLSVLAYAGRMVDRASDRASQERATSLKGVAASGSGGLEASRTSKKGEGEQDRES